MIKALLLDQSGPECPCKTLTHAVRERARTHHALGRDGERERKRERERERGEKVGGKRVSSQERQNKARGFYL